MAHNIHAYVAKLITIEVEDVRRLLENDNERKIQI